ncbi:MAG TPA: DUF2442 domain-containing protein [Allosphingosinicella sp.]
MVDLTAAEIAAARERGRVYRATKLHAKSARYDGRNDRIVIELESGATFAFPPRLVEGLAGAAPAHLAEVELLGDGEALHWEELDVDYSVAGLVNGVFGTSRWMAARAGRATSPAKAAAARANGAKGGRPRKAG